MEEIQVNEIKNRHRILWLATGMIAGLAIASIWPHEPALAVSNDRTKSFGMATMPVLVTEEREGVVILNYRTGRLVGAVLNNQTGVFTAGFYRNIAADFEVGRGAEYTMVGGKCLLPNKGVSTMASGVIYVAELRSGKVAAYGLPFDISSRRKTNVEMTAIDFFSFSDAIVE
jgi:hypothetical protein